MSKNLFGNPHSASESSQLSTQRVEDTRLKVLRFFNASPYAFDVVFVANATAGIKMVADAFRDQEGGFFYGYHRDAHTSLVGVRELASRGQRCFKSTEEMEAFVGINAATSRDHVSLFAYPGQSNMTGNRHSTATCRKIDAARTLWGHMYSLYDAASLVSTSPLDLSDASSSPDFTALSFYKIFGFPDLGALIIKKEAGHVFHRRKYFGGGTTEMIITQGEKWHSPKQQTLHDRLEDGTLPFHNIVALDVAITTHQRLFGSMKAVSQHCAQLAQHLCERLSNLRHANGIKVCEIYNITPDYTKTKEQGPIITFNLITSRWQWVSKTEVEKLAAIKNIQIRSGSLCNPGGMAYHLKLSPEELRRNYAEGLRCGDEHDIMEGKPTGALRISLGAMSNLADIETVMGFLEEFYVDKAPSELVLDSDLVQISSSERFYVESLSIYPIKSCAAFKIPPNISWKIKREGLAWDREWCLVHQGTGAALSQKRYPQMTLLRPTLDLEHNQLRISYGIGADERSIDISLDRETAALDDSSLCGSLSAKASSLCGDKVTVHVYTSPEVSSFFTDALKVPCTLARSIPLNFRYAKARRQPYQNRKQTQVSMPGAFPSRMPDSSTNRILLSNESPILMISRSSVNRLNEQIKEDGGRAVPADVFRANIIIAESPAATAPNDEQPYAEDTWKEVHISDRRFDVMGSCQRCQMVCIDQYSGVRSEEPFSTLAKTRRFDGKVFFGQHICPADDGDDDDTLEEEGWTIQAGDAVVPKNERD